MIETDHNEKPTMKTTTKTTIEPTKDQTPKDQVPRSKAPKAKGELAVKTPKAAQAGAEGEPADRLPANLDDLKATKSGLVAFLFLSGKGKDDIVTQLKETFKLTDVQAGKIARRITGRARFFKRVFELMPTK